MLIFSLLFAAQVANPHAASKPFVPEPSAIAAPALKLSPAKSWKRQTPKNGFRIAQYALPIQKGDSEAPLLVVYWFGPEGVGSVDANFNRWSSQLSEQKSKAKRSKGKLKELPLHRIDATGRFVAEVMPGAGKRVNKESFRLLGAIWELPEGPLYFKLTGPSKSVAAQKKNFESFLSGLSLEIEKGLEL